MPAAVGLRRFGPVDRTIGRFAENVIEAGRSFGIGLQEFEGRPDVAGEQNSYRRGAASRHHFHLDRGGAEEMAGVPVARPHARHRLEPCTIADGGKLLHRRFGIGDTINRLDKRPPAPRIAGVQLANFGFLHMARIRQHDGTEIDGRLGGMNPVAEPVFHQFGYQPGMVDVGVGQEHGVDRRRLEGKGAGIESALGLRSLEHAAVDEQPMRARIQEVT
jgi:hypothetical protein